MELFKSRLTQNFQEKEPAWKHHPEREQGTKAEEFTENLASKR